MWNKLSKSKPIKHIPAEFSAWQGRADMMKCMNCDYSFKYDGCIRWGTGDTTTALKMNKHDQEIHGLQGQFR